MLIWNASNFYNDVQRCFIKFRYKMSVIFDVIFYFYTGQIGYKIPVELV